MVESRKPVSGMGGVIVSFLDLNIRLEMARFWTDEVDKKMINRLACFVQSRFGYLAHLQMLQRLRTSSHRISLTITFPSASFVLSSKP